MKKVLLVLSLLFFSTIGFSQTVQSWENALSNQRGFYLDGGVGTVYSHEDVFGYTFNESGGFAGVLFLGYQVNRYLAAEAGINYANVSSDSLTYYPIAIKGTLPLGEEKRFKLFGKLGAAFAHDDSEGFWGIGAAYGVLPNLDVGIELNAVSSLFSSVGLATINLIYHF